MMKISDMLQIALIGLSGAAAMIHLTKDDSGSPKKNPKVIPPEKIALLTSVHEEYISDDPNSRSTDELAASLGMSAPTLLAKFRELGLPTRQKPILTEEHLASIDWPAVYAEYKSRDPESRTTAEIAASIGMSVGSLMKNFKRLGFKIEEHKKTTKAHLASIDWYALHAEYMSGARGTGLMPLGARHGIAFTTVRDKFKSLGLPIRPQNDLISDIDWYALHEEYMNIEGPNARTTKAIAKDAGISYPTMIAKFRELGLSIRSVLKTKRVIPSTASKAEKSLEPSYAEYSKNIPSMYRQGANLQGLYIHYDRRITLNTILQVLKDNGLQIKNTEPAVKYYLDGLSVDRISEMLYGTFNKDQIIAILVAADVGFRAPS